MAEAEIPVDLFNPGQVFACLGFLEAADILLGDAEGGYDWRDGGAIRFRLRSKGDDNPFEAVLRFLAEAELKAIAPEGSILDLKKHDIPTLSSKPNTPFPFPEPRSLATLPIQLADKHQRKVLIEHWGDNTKRDNVKFWAGAAGYPGAALARDALDLVRDHLNEAVNDPFSLSAPQTSSFRFDWRRDYIPIDLGFSPNYHDDIIMVGFPLVELLAAIGLSNARPERLDKLNYRYSVLGISPREAVYDPIFLRAALGSTKLPFPQRTFRMCLGWPGQENQARCITDVFEEVT